MCDIGRPAIVFRYGLASLNVKRRSFVEAESLHEAMDSRVSARTGEPAQQRRGVPHDETIIPTAYER